jgi:hypothetical protein
MQMLKAGMRHRLNRIHGIAPPFMPGEAAKTPVPALNGGAADEIIWAPASARLLDEGGPTGQPFERMNDDFSETTAHEHLARIVERHPAKVAVSDGSTSLSYKDLMRAVHGNGRGHCRCRSGG